MINASIINKRLQIMRCKDCFSCVPCCSVCREEQTHVHELIGSVRLAELGEDPHNHRFAGITGEVIRVPGGHIHEFRSNTDFYENHFHPICVRTELNIQVGEGDDERHIHFIDANTEVEDGHHHEFIAATLIENPIGN